MGKKPSQYVDENSENFARSNSPMKISKVIGGFFLGFFLASAFTSTLIPQSEISPTTDIFRLIVSLCAGIIGAVIIYKRVNLKKYED